MNRIMGYSRLVVACAILACTVLVAAQGGGGGGGRGGGDQGRGGFGQRGLGNDATGLNLLRRADVQRDLNVTQEQKDKITALQDEMRGGGFGGGGGGRGAGGGGGFGGGGGGGNFDPQAMREAMEKRNAETLEKLGKILDANQMKRLKEIRIQLAKNNAILMPDVQKDLGVTEAQKTKIADLQTKQREAMMSLFQDQGMSREDRQAAMEKNNQVMDAELGKILTSEQSAKLKEMGGKEFKADPPQGGGGGN